jgi:hypothetical protein
VRICRNTGSPRVKSGGRGDLAKGCTQGGSCACSSGAGGPFDALARRPAGGYRGAGAAGACDDHGEHYAPGGCDGLGAPSARIPRKSGC